ncbi:MAG: tetratricopeptide repeat protein, partial [Bacteroidetes bacterium]|nr:tetratricopeptide repeat protein [Bacteroidota bacterium]
NRYGEIRAAYFQKNYEKAIELAQKAIKETPNDVRFYSILADIYYSQKDYPRTIEVLNQLLLVEPQHVSTMGNLSYYYLFVKDYAAAEQMARKALAIDSTQTWINTNLASAILFQDRYEEAEKIILELKDEDCLNTTCAEAWLDDFTQFQKAGVIPENQKENLRKIQRLLDEDWEKKLTYEQEQKAIEIVTIWFEEMRKANDVNRIMQVSDVPFAFNNERVLSTTGDLREAYSEFFKNKEQTTIPTYEVEIWDYENRIVWGYIPINIVRVVVMINDEDGDVEEQIVVGVSIRDNTFKVVGFY